MDEERLETLKRIELLVEATRLLKAIRVEVEKWGVDREGQMGVEARRDATARGGGG